MLRLDSDSYKIITKVFGNLTLLEDLRDKNCLLNHYWVADDCLITHSHVQDVS